MKVISYYVIKVGQRYWGDEWGDNRLSMNPKVARHSFESAKLTTGEFNEP